MYRPLEKEMEIEIEMGGSDRCGEKKELKWRNAVVKCARVEWKMRAKKVEVYCK